MLKIRRKSTIIFCEDRLCVKIGFDIKTLSELPGHTTVETTLNRYVHSSMERKAECMNLLQMAA